MLTALCRAFYALSSPPLRRTVALSLTLAVLTFALLWLAVAGLLYNTTFFDWRPLNWLVDLMGGVAVLGLSWLFFPAVVTLIMSLFLERVAAAVEALDYPGSSPPRRQPIRETLGAMFRLTTLTLLLNLLALPLYLLLPGINLFLFLALNGYLLGREYFEVVALRRLDAAAARTARNRFGLRVFLGGGGYSSLIRLTADQPRSAGDRHGIHAACLRSAAAHRAAPPDPVCDVILPSTMSIGCPIHV